MSNDMRLVGEEILGAELVAGKGLSQAAGTVLDVVERGFELQREQWKLLVDDYAIYLNTITTSDMKEWPYSFSGLVNRRLMHINEGWRKAATLVNDEYQPLRSVWSDFLHVVRQDWHD